MNVSAVVYHGGAGTAACDLKNGLPTLGFPFFDDQPFWGDMVAAAGAGPRPIHHKTLTAEKLAEAIRFLRTPQVAQAAGRIAQRMSTEKGVKIALVKGGFVDISFALTQGLRNAPAMYGDKPGDLGPMAGWKSGGVVAGKGLGFGLYDSISGLITDHIRGARKEGALGALKGFGKGLGGINWKPNAGLGLLGYTVQGIYKSVFSAMYTGTRKSIAAASRAEGAWILAMAREKKELDLRDIVVAFEELKFCTCP